MLPLTDKQAEYARSVAGALRDAGFRVGLDERPEKLGARIRDAQLMKIPYMLIAGGREAEAKTISVRSRTEGDRGAVDLPALMEMWRAEEASRGLAPG